MDITTRAQAFATGSTTYYTGKQCKHGHVAARRTDSGACVECLKDGRKRFPQATVDYLNAKAQGLELFTYRLHAVDVPALLAYAQLLDAQRGRTPYVPQAPVTDVKWVTPEEVRAEQALRWPHIYAPAGTPHEFKP